MTSSTGQLSRPLLASLCVLAVALAAGCGEEGTSETAEPTGTQTAEADEQTGGAQATPDDDSSGDQASAGGIRGLLERGVPYGSRVRFEGRATSLGDAGLLLQDSTGSIIALAPAIPAAEIEGVELTVTGTLRPFTQFQVGELRESAAAVGEMPLFGRAPLGAGDPYLDLKTYAYGGG